ncbi:unnamed protein product [Ectocarpus fasciculatus]
MRRSSQSGKVVCCMFNDQNLYLVCCMLCCLAAFLGTPIVFCAYGSAFQTTVVELFFLCPCPRCSRYRLVGKVGFNSRARFVLHVGVTSAISHGVRVCAIIHRIRSISYMGIKGGRVFPRLPRFSVQRQRLYIDSCVASTRVFLLFRISQSSGLAWFY